MAQKYIAREKRIFSNGAIGWAPGGYLDCIGPFAKVQNCPIMVGGAEAGRLTCYASNVADTLWTIPANTRKNGRYVAGFFHYEDGSVAFRPFDRYTHLFNTKKGA